MNIQFEENVIDAYSAMLSIVINNTPAGFISVRTRGLDFFDLVLSDSDLSEKEILQTYIMAEEKGWICYVESFSILPEFKNQGYGKKLLQHLCDTFKFTAIVLNASPLTPETNKERLIEFYQKYGNFQIIQRDDHQCIMLKIKS